MPSGKLHIVPLGGLGEFGMNCMAVRWGDDIIVVDAGLMFPEAELLGVDIVVPDISYLTENRQHVRAIILTHGHEDHIGALPWILSELNVPVWGTEFTLAYVEDKLDEHQLLDDADLREIRPGERFKIGPFTVHAIQVTHSLVDCVALAIHTPLGVVLHTGDFKVDPTPTDNRLFDLHAFAEYGKEGVLALLQDSTNVERKGYTPSERSVRRKFDEVFSHTQRRLFISCFSSSIHRIKLAVDVAREHGRKVCFIGRSMVNSSEIAEDLGYIQIPEGLLIQPGEMKNYAPEKVCVLISGTQDTSFGTGGSRAARYFHSFDLGLTWTVVETTIASGKPSAGIFSLGLGEHNEIIAIGGDYKEPISTDHVAAYSFDGGKTWKTAAQQPRGYRSAVAHLDGAKWVAVGPSGADISDDSGVHWKHTDSLNLNAVAILDPKHGWAVGPKGTVARFVDRAIPYRRSRGKRPATPQPAPPVAH